MFGFGRQKTYTVVLTQKELDYLMASMSRQEKKEFEKRQKGARLEAYDEGFIDGMASGD